MSVSAVSVQSQGHSEVQLSVNVCPAEIFLTTEPFVTKLGIVLHHHEPECHTQRLVCQLKDQGHSEGLYNQNMTVSTLSYELLILLQPNLW